MPPESNATEENDEYVNGTLQKSFSVSNIVDKRYGCSIRSRLGTDTKWTKPNLFGECFFNLFMNSSYSLGNTISVLF